MAADWTGRSACGSWSRRKTSRNFASRLMMPLRPCSANRAGRKKLRTCGADAAGHGDDRSADAGRETAFHRRPVAVAPVLAFRAADAAQPSEVAEPGEAHVAASCQRETITGSGL